MSSKEIRPRRERRFGLVGTLSIVCLTALALKASAWEGDEHRKLTRLILGELLVGGLGDGDVLALPIDDWTSGLRGSKDKGVPYPYPVNSIARQFQPMELSETPDLAYGFYDWINQLNFDEYLCPPLPEGAEHLVLCHEFQGWLGALNSTHFGSQAELMYEHYHQIAVQLAGRASKLRESLSAGQSLPPRFAEYVREAEYEALGMEAYAQHFLQDRWSMGHMWQRWGSGNYDDWPLSDSGPNVLTPFNPCFVASVVGVVSGMIHGHKAISGVDDLMNMPIRDPENSSQITTAEWSSRPPLLDDVIPGQDEEMSAVWKWPTVDTGVGDFFQEAMVNGGFHQGPVLRLLDTARQKEKFLDCSSRGWAEVVRNFGTDSEFALIESATTDDVLSPDCWNHWATNASMADGLISKHEARNVLPKLKIEGGGCFDSGGDEDDDDDNPNSEGVQLSANERALLIKIENELFERTRIRARNTVPPFPLTPEDMLEYARRDTDLAAGVELPAYGVNRKEIAKGVAVKLLEVAARSPGRAPWWAKPRRAAPSDPDDDESWFTPSTEGDICENDKADYVLPNQCYDLPSYNDAYDPDNGGFEVMELADKYRVDGGRSYLPIYGYFNKAHADYFCKNGVEIMNDLRDAPFAGSQSICTDLAARFFRGTPPAYDGSPRHPSEKFRGLDTGEEPVCKYLDDHLLPIPSIVEDDLARDRDDREPYYLDPGYTDYAHDGEEDDPTRIQKALAAWCDRAPAVAPGNMDLMTAYNAASDEPVMDFEFRGWNLRDGLKEVTLSAPADSQFEASLPCTLTHLPEPELRDRARCRIAAGTPGLSQFWNAVWSAPPAGGFPLLRTFNVTAPGLLDSWVTVKWPRKDHVLVVMDISGSMNDEAESGFTVIEEARSATLNLIEAMGREDRLAVATFNEKWTVLQNGYTASPRDLELEVASLVASGKTALYESLRRAAQMAAAERARYPGSNDALSNHTVVVLSDGGNNVIGATLQQAIDEINRAKIPVNLVFVNMIGVMGGLQSQGAGDINPYYRHGSNSLFFDRLSGEGGHCRGLNSRHLPGYVVQTGDLWDRCGWSPGDIILTWTPRAPFDSVNLIGRATYMDFRGFCDFRGFAQECPDQGSNEPPFAEIDRRSRYGHYREITNTPDLRTFMRSLVQ